MSGILKKTESVTSKWKEIAVEDGNFIDPESGEVIEVASILEKAYGTGTIFTLSTSNKVETEIE